MKKRITKMKYALLIFSISFLTLPIVAQDLQQCLSNSIENWQSENPIEGLSEKIQRDFAESSFILSGEVHTIWESIELRFEILKSLMQHQQFNHLILEVGASRGYILNQYLNSADESLLDFAFRTNGDPVLEKRKEIWIKRLAEIRAINRTLPYAEQVKIIGVDIERHGFAAVAYVLKKEGSNLYLNSNEDDALKEIINLIEKSEKEKQLKKPFKKIYHSAGVQSILAKESTNAFWLLATVIKGLKFKLDGKPFRQRDEFMHQRLLNYHRAKRPDQHHKYYFQIGVNHLKTSKNWFATYILNDKELMEALKPKLIRMEYFGFEKNIFGSKFKNGELSKIDIKPRQLSSIMGENKIAIFPSKECQADSKIDYQFLILE